MTDEKLNGIIKALKLCTGIETACKDCPYRASVSPSFSVRCEDTLHKASLEAIETLKAENAALRERLSKAVELPCKVGDKVYIPWVWDNQSGIMEAPVITIRLYPYIRKYEIRLETDSLNFAQKYHYGNFNDKDFGTLIFTTREAAEARLKELQGEKK